MGLTATEGCLLLGVKSVLLLMLSTIQSADGHKRHAAGQVPASRWMLDKSRLQPLTCRLMLHRITVMDALLPRCQPSALLWTAKAHLTMPSPCIESQPCVLRTSRRQARCKRQPAGRRQAGSQGGRDCGGGMGGCLGRAAQHFRGAQRRCPTLHSESRMCRSSLRIPHLQVCRQFRCPRPGAELLNTCSSTAMVLLMTCVAAPGCDGGETQSGICRHLPNICRGRPHCHTSYGLRQPHPC